MALMQLQHGTDWPQPPTPHNKLVVHLTHQMFAHFICPILTYIIPADKMITSFIVTSFNNDYFVYHYWLNYWHTLISKDTPASPPPPHPPQSNHRAPTDLATPTFRAATHARPNLLIRKKANPILPQMRGTRKQILATYLPRCSYHLLYWVVINIFDEIELLCLKFLIATLQ